MAYQGEPGAHSEIALRKLLGPGVPALGVPTFRSLFARLREGRVDQAIAPIENSTMGTIPETRRELLRGGLAVVGGLHLPIDHALLALPGVRISELRSVRSHPHALAQCKGNLARMGLKLETAEDTAGSAREVVEQGERSVAALASAEAARLHRLSVLRVGLADRTPNVTRFLLLRRSPSLPPQAAAARPPPSRRTTELDLLRLEVQRVDLQLQRGILHRLDLARRIGEVKARSGSEVRDPRTEALVRTRWRDGLALASIEPERADRLAEWLLAESVRVQKALTSHGGRRVGTPVRPDPALS
ncbi:MAG: chorismate mutase [Euryarchaeota archaeon]|nr:chorismate mutase [Euryarchaeota archaeon]MDE1835117.1 chorismate mutase [Euryarchaeota archaeon]MDE1880697.1 chorismate mutase [Euryarchaeota archaeon]